jgi:hypothetical protein
MEEHNLDEPRCSTRNFVQLAEMLLCFHAFYKSGHFWKSDDKDAPKTLDKALRRMMLQLTTTLNRGEGTMNWNLQKIHEILHLPMQMTEYGSPANYDAGVGESGLKHWAKRPARRALKGSIDVFTASTASRVHEGLVIAKAANCLGITSLPKRNVHNLSSRVFSNGSASSSNVGSLVGKAKYMIKVEGVDEESYPLVVTEWLSSADSVTLPQGIIDIFFEEFFQDSTEEGDNSPIIRGYTEYRIPSGELVRAHPNYGGKGPLYDWAVIIEPAQRYDFLLGKTVPQLVDEDNEPLMSKIEKLYPNHVPARIIALFKDPKTDEDMAIVHACRPWSSKNYEHTSVITESWNLQVVRQKFWELEDGSLSPQPNPDAQTEVERLSPIYHVIPARDIKEGLFAIQEDNVLADSWPMNNASGHVIVIHDRETFWADEFMKYD